MAFLWNLGHWEILSFLHGMFDGKCAHGVRMHAWETLYGNYVYARRCIAQAFWFVDMRPLGPVILNELNICAEH